MSHTTITADQAQAFWEERYKNSPAKSSGQPSAMLREFAGTLSPGRALELGCGKGDDAVWLATHGWSVTAADISREALGYAAENAQAAGVADKIDFQQHDLAKTFPVGSYDLVYAMFLQTPAEFPRAEILQKAVAAVAKGGMLLIVSHGAAPPWGNAPEGYAFPTPEGTLAELEADPEQWEHIFAGLRERPATGPQGQKATLIDMVVALRRL